MSAPAPARVSVVIVSYRTRDLLRRCLETVRAQAGVTVECWVVDNASGDGSAEMVAAEFPEVRLLANRDNPGFARANNQALAQANGDVLALVNPDTELPGGALAAVAAAFARHPRAGAVGLALRGSDGRPQASCHAFPGVLNACAEASGLWPLLLRLGYGTPTAAPEPAPEGRVDWVLGAFMALRRGAYAQVGGLPDARFLYGEEMDWSWRAKRAGWETWHVASPAVLHHGGASGAGLRGQLHVMVLESRLDWLRRYRGAWRAALVREVFALGALLRWTYWSLRALAAREVPLHVREQRERFGAVLAWRLGRSA